VIPFGHYFLVQRLTVGGMAEVFLATHREDPKGPLLVVKRILPHLQDRSDFVQMFLDEARLTSNLFHDNLVRVHDFGKAEGVHYIAMEYVDGLSLSLILRRQPQRRLPRILSCWTVAEACGGLAYAHSRTDDDGQPLNIVHRDVSPDNILISKHGEVKLVDFGIAKAEIQLTRTRPGQIKGKYSYMSPEQGMRLKIDHRSDIFSAGLVLFEATTGVRVFPAGNEVETLQALYERRYTPPEEIVPDYPPQLAAVVNRALCWDPEKRFQNATDMREALLELIPGSAAPARDLSVLVQCLREQMQLKLPEPGQASSAPETKQQSPPRRVAVPAPSDRDTLLGIGTVKPRKGEAPARVRAATAPDQEAGTPDKEDATVLQDRPPFSDPDIVPALFSDSGDEPPADGPLEPHDTDPTALLADASPHDEDQEPEPADVDIDDDRDTIKVPALPDDFDLPDDVDDR